MPKNKKYIRIGITLIVLGVLGLVFPYLSIGFFREQNFIDKTVQQYQPLFVVQSPSPTPDPNAPNIKNRLIIPSADIDMALIQSNSESALWRGGWVFPNASTPEQGGNTIIFGHRFKYLPPITNTLYYLDKAKVGDQFTILWKGRQYQYKVSEVKVINPTDVYVLNPSDKAQVTIITCFPLFSTKQRLVVIGSLVK